jgi:hypothetical protein
MGMIVAIIDIKREVTPASSLSSVLQRTYPGCLSLSSLFFLAGTLRLTKASSGVACFERICSSARESLSRNPQLVMSTLRRFVAPEEIGNILSNLLADFSLPGLNQCIERWSWW